MSFALGPLGISVERFIVFLAFLVAWLAGWLAGRRRGVSIETVLSQMFLGGLVTARLAFVFAYREDYGVSPLAWLDIRDGGLMPWPGLLAAAGIAGFHYWRFPRVRRPLIVAASAALLTVALTLGPLKLMRSVQPSLPELPLVTLQGREALLSDLGGRPAVVNLWATWCPPCRREMPVLADAQKKFPQVAFIFVNQGESQSTVREFLKQEHLQLDNVLLDFRSSASLEFGARAMPTTLFFNADGQLVDTHLGELSPATLKRRMKHFQLDEPEE